MQHLAVLVIVAACAAHLGWRLWRRLRPARGPGACQDGCAGCGGRGDAPQSPGLAQPVRFFKRRPD